MRIVVLGILLSLMLTGVALSQSQTPYTPRNYGGEFDESEYLRKGLLDRALESERQQKAHDLQIQLLFIASCIAVGIIGYNRRRIISAVFDLLAAVSAAARSARKWFSEESKKAEERRNR